MNVLLNIGVGLLTAMIFSVFCVCFFDIELFKARLYQKFNLKFYKTFDRLRSRSQLISLFNQTFVSYSKKKGGRILLMSHEGGLPEFDPYIRIVELAAHQDLTIYIATSAQSVRQYCSGHPDIAKRLIAKKNVHLYIFDNYTPYYYRIGVNTETGLGFFCAYHGHVDNKVDLEGIVTSNKKLVTAIEYLYMGLLSEGVRITQENCGCIGLSSVTA